MYNNPKSKGQKVVSKVKPLLAPTKKLNNIPSQVSIVDTLINRQLPKKTYGTQSNNNSTENLKGFN